jgi:hypothetical protein
LNTAAAEILEERALLAATALPPEAAAATADTARTPSTASAAVSSIDGSGHNAAHPEWGKAGTNFLRVAPADYSDGKSAPAGTDRPSPREISNVLVAQGDVDIISDRELSAMIYAWGQFLDHDIDLTTTGGTEQIQIPIPEGDGTFEPGTTMNTMRSTFDALTGNSTSNPRQQVNSITAWVDGSQIYGSDAQTATSLRTLSGGKLKTSEGNLLPVGSNGFFQAGDVRANENPELTSLQTLFVREHNQLATRLAQQNPRWTDEQLYQGARAIVIGELQAITYNEWLPALLGQGALDRYRGYNPNVNPGIANEFATAGFRLGHSLLGNDIEFLDNNGNEIADEVGLQDAFFNPALVRQNNIDPILKYLASDPSSELDTKLVDGVRNFLSPAPGVSGFDLAALNIARGRDHGLADYNAVREAYGLRPVTRFSQITSDREVQAKLQDLYGDVNNIDLWVGALAEDHVRGASVGPTLRAIISDQFERLRDGDRFFYENHFSGAQLKQIRNTTLSDVIKRNTDLTNLQQNAFFFKASVSGTIFADTNGDGRQGRNESGLRGRTIQLVDGENGEIIATQRTDAEGKYSFDVSDGIRTGEYLVRDAASGRTGGAVAYTRGDQSYTLNLGIRERGDHGPRTHRDAEQLVRLPGSTNGRSTDNWSLLATDSVDSSGLTQQTAEEPVWATQSMTKNKTSAATSIVSDAVDQATESATDSGRLDDLFSSGELATLFARLG